MNRCWTEEQKQKPTDIVNNIVFKTIAHTNFQFTKNYNF